MLCLHIGLPKTGTSAIQHFLRGHAGWLSDAGFHYALTPEAAPDADGVSSGNALALVRYLDPRRRPEAFSVASFERTFEATYLSDRHSVSIISSEFLASAGADQLLRFRDQVVGDRPVMVIAAVRSLYGHAFSTWGQLVKRHAYSRSFAHFAQRQYFNSQIAVLRRYGKCFGWDRLKLIRYDQHQHDIVGAFLAELGAPQSPDRQAPRINRSLSRAELDVQLILNRLHGSPGLATAVSDRFVSERPDGASGRVWRPDVARSLADRFGDEVRTLARKTGQPLEALLEERSWGDTTTASGEYAQATADALGAMWSGFVRGAVSDRRREQDEPEPSLITSQRPHYQ